METEIGQPRLSMLRFGARFCLSCAFLAALFYVAGPWYVKAFLPLFKWELKVIHPEYEILKLGYEESGALITYHVRIHRREVDSNGQAWGGQEVKGSVWASGLYIQPILFFSLLAAWPGLALKDWPKLALVAVPLLIGINLIDMPVHIIQKLEEGYPVDSLVGSVRDFWWNVLNNGGRQFLAIVAAGVAAGIAKMPGSGVPADRRKVRPSGRKQIGS